MRGGTRLLSLNYNQEIRVYSIVFAAVCIVAYLLLLTPSASAASLRTADSPDEVLPAGVNYQYYQVYSSSIPDFDELLIADEGYADNFDISERTQDDHFAFQWQAYFHAPVDGEYTFYTTSDDGSMVYIGDEEVVYNDGLHIDRERSGSIGLAAGMHEITVQYFENDGIQTFELEYKGPGQGKSEIPDTYLTRAYEIEYRAPDEPSEETQGLYYEYYEEKASKMPAFDLLEPVKTGYVTNISFNPARQENYYQFRYRGYFLVETEGVYQFYLNSDDGSRLYIGDDLIVDNDRTHTVRERSGSIGLEAGYHEITIEYFEWIGDSVLQVYYEGPDSEKVNIPDEAFIRYTPSGDSGYYGEEYGDEIYDGSNGDDDSSDDSSSSSSDDDSDDNDGDSDSNGNSSSSAGSTTEVIYITNPSICEEPAKSVTAMRRGKIKVSYTEGGYDLYKIFKTKTTKKVKIRSYDNSSYVAVLGPTGKKLKMVNICNGEVEDTERVAKQIFDHTAIKLKDVRYDGSTEVIVTATKGDWVKVTLVRVNKVTKKFKKKTTERFQTARNVAARKTKRRKRDGDHKLLIRDHLDRVVKTYKVTKKYNLKALD